MLSLSMIAKNEEETIERVLACAKNICDEMVVVDTGSTDRTVELAERMGAKVFHFEWVDDFAAARNFSLDCCQGDWVMWLDADDVIPEVSQKAILALKETTLLDETLDGVFMMYRTHINEEGACLHSVTRERIFRRLPQYRWEHPVHECITFPGSRIVHRSDIWIEHHPLAQKYIFKEGRNIRILEKAIGRGDESCRTLFYYANELKDRQRFEEAIPVYQKYLAKSQVDWERYSALLYLANCYEATNNQDEAVQTYLNAILTDSRRAEAYNLMGRHFYQQQDWARAVPFFETATRRNKSDAWGFVSDQDYAWLPYDYLSVCLERLGRYEESIQTILKALPGNPDKSRLIRNLHFLVDLL